jgi:hypothetical protein
MIQNCTFLPPVVLVLCFEFSSSLVLVKPLIYFMFWFYYFSSSLKLRRIYTVQLIVYSSSLKQDFQFSFSLVLVWNKNFNLV